MCEGFSQRCCGAKDSTTLSNTCRRRLTTSRATTAPLVALSFRSKGAIEEFDGFIAQPTTNLLPTGRSRPTVVSGKRPESRSQSKTWAGSRGKNPVCSTSSSWATLHADLFALPSAYNETMRVHIRALRENHAIQTLDTTIMLARTVRYDKLHLEDETLNRKYMTNHSCRRLPLVSHSCRRLPLVLSQAHQRRRPPEDIAQD